MVGRTARARDRSASLSSASRRRRRRRPGSRTGRSARRSSCAPAARPGRRVLAASTCSSSPAISVCGRHPVEHRHRRPRRRAGRATGNRAERGTASRATASSSRVVARRAGTRRRSARTPVADRVLERPARRRVRVALRRHGARSAAATDSPSPAGRRRSKSVSKAGRCSWRLTSVAASAARSCSRSSRSTAPHGLDRVEPLGHRDRQPGLAQSGDEADVPIEQRHRRDGQAEFLGARAWSEGCLRTTPSVRGDRLLVEVVDAEGEQGARPVDGLGDRGRLLQLQRAQGRGGPRQLLRERRLDVGHLGQDDVALALGRSGSRGAGTGSAA